MSYKKLCNLHLDLNIACTSVFQIAKTGKKDSYMFWLNHWGTRTVGNTIGFEVNLWKRELGGQRL